MRLRRPSRSEAVVQTLLGLLFAGLMAEYVMAAGAVPCGDQETAAALGCYPWGAEGPAAELWYYADKDVYLRSMLAGGLVVAIAAMAPFFARGRWSGLGAIVAILALGFTQMKGLTGLIGSW